MCLGKGEMNPMPMHFLNTFFKILAYNVEISLHDTYQNLSLKTVKIDNFRSMKPPNKGVPSGNWMSKIQLN